MTEISSMWSDYIERKHSETISVFQKFPGTEQESTKRWEPSNVFGTLQNIDEEKIFSSLREIEKIRDLKFATEYPLRSTHPIGSAVGESTFRVMDEGESVTNETLRNLCKEKNAVAVVVVVVDVDVDVVQSEHVYQLTGIDDIFSCYLPEYDGQVRPQVFVFGKRTLGIDSEILKLD